MMKRRIATYVGTGSVLTDNDEVTASYHLDVYEGGALKQIEGSVHSPYLTAGRALLTLVTKEGHRLKFFLVKADGTIVATSAFVDSDGYPAI